MRPGIDPAQLEAMGVDVERVRKSLRRRFVLLLAGAAIAVVGGQLEPEKLGVPEFTGVAVMVLGGLVGLGGLLGLRRGAGCLAQLVAIVWISAIACGVGPTDRATLGVLTGMLVVLVAAALLLPKKQNPSPFTVTLPRQGPAGPEGEGAGPVIDVEARETGDDDASS